MDNEDPVAEQLLRLEKKLFKSAEKRNIKEIETIIADEFEEFGRSGRVYNKQEVIDILLQPSDELILIENFNAVELFKDMILVTYIAVKGNLMNSDEKRSLRSSIWKFNNGQWQIVFHQGTQMSL